MVLGANVRGAQVGTCVLPPIFEWQSYISGEYLDSHQLEDGRGEIQGWQTRCV